MMPASWAHVVRELDFPNVWLADSSVHLKTVFLLENFPQKLSFFLMRNTTQLQFHQLDDRPQGEQMQTW
jgi:hypothetical protein